MRAHWDAQIALGHVPTGRELNEAAGVDLSSSLGRMRRGKWQREALAAVEAITGERVPA
jgi:hypothetical protein